MCRLVKQDPDLMQQSSKPIPMYGALPAWRREEFPETASLAFSEEEFRQRQEEKQSQSATSVRHTGRTSTLTVQQKRQPEMVEVAYSSD